MKQMFLSFGLLLFILSASAQEKITLQRERESFDGSDWAWSSRVNQDIYNCYITDQGNYLLSLPPGSWGFTFAGLPAQLKTIEKLRNGELNFDFKIKSMYGDRFSIGLLFDFYGATDQCLGGNFYNLRIYGSNDVVSASIEQRKDCAYVPKATVASTGSAKINLKAYNHVSIKKNGVRYEVFINEVRVLVFEYTGAINFARLYWERGEYFLDNFVVNETIYSTTPAASPVVSATPTDQARPKLYVLSIGINVYDSGLNPQRTLNGCVNDAVAMRNFYTGVGGGAVEVENIALLTNSGATINNILASANRIFSKAGSNDVIITFLSGHGGVGAFCAYDGDLPYERINQIINKSAASKLCIVDACHAGSWNVNSVLGDKGMMNNPQDALTLFYSRLSAAGKGINWLLACRPDELSQDGDPNGVFTNTVLTGLNGKAETNSDNIVTLGELTSYLDKRFEQFNIENRDRKYQNGKPVRMTPQFFGNGNTSIPLAVLYKSMQ